MTARTHHFVDALSVFALVAFAVVQPLLDVLARSAPFFVAHRTSPAELLGLLGILCIGLPTAMIAATCVAGVAGPLWRMRVQWTLVGLLVAAVSLPLLHRLVGLPDKVALAGAGLLGAVSAVAYTRLAIARSFLTAASVAALTFPAVFLFTSPVSEIFLPGPEPLPTHNPVRSPAPVVFVIFDGLGLTELMDERSRVDPIRYPAFAALARHATWYRNGTTVSEFTTTSVPAILTGRHTDTRPEGGGELGDPALTPPPTAAQYPQNLFSLLGESYDLRVFESATALCPSQYCDTRRPGGRPGHQWQSLLSDVSLIYLHVLLPPHLRSALPSLDDKWAHFLAPGAPTKPVAPRSGDPDMRPADLFADFLDAIEPVGEPTLFFIHCLLPHPPLRFLPSGMAYVAPPRLRAHLTHTRWSDDDAAVLQAHQRYLLQVAFVDTLLGRLLERLEAADLYDRTLLVVTSDHGMSFRAGRRRRMADESNFFDILPVPLFIKAPNQRTPRISDRNVETIDVLPAVADALGVEIPWPVDGRSPSDSESPDRESKTVYRLGKRFEYPATLAGRRRALQRKLARFGAGTRSEELFAVGPGSDLVGRSLADLELAEFAPYAVELRDELTFDRVDPASGVVPAFIRGWLSPEAGAPPLPTLAVSINGTIRAVVPSFIARGGRTAFEAIVSEQSFRPNRNRVEIFAVDASEERVRLRQLLPTLFPMVNPS